MMIPILDKSFKEKFEAIRNLVLAEVNVKDVEYITDTTGILVKKIKPNFKELGPKFGKHGCYDASFPSPLITLVRIFIPPKRNSCIRDPELDIVASELGPTSFTISGLGVSVVSESSVILNYII